MKQVFLLLAWTSLLAAGPIANRYIVELDQAPVADRVQQSGLPHTSRRAAAHSPGMEAYRQLLQSRQKEFRRQAEAVGGRFVGAVDTLANVVVVQIADSDSAKLVGIPGVKRVVQARTLRRHLDQAVVLHRATDLWSQIGIEHAGAGSKVAILDTGIDVTHPGFQDAALPAPGGFPIVGSDSDAAYTNNKVIVARSYVSRLNADPDPSPADHIGHGTFVAMIVGGTTNTGPLAPITGMAPKAYLGNYKVFGSPGSNDSMTDDVVIAALEDAWRDGMDVANLSLGSPAPPSLDDDIEVSAVERAVYLGMLVTVSAGNSGPDATTVESPGTSPSALTVGATYNGRQFLSPVTVNSVVYASTPGDGFAGRDDISGDFADVATLDPSGLTCSGLPAGSLQGKIALIQRGTCTFEVKLNNAKAAGAIGAVIYTNANPVTIMAIGSATLPAVMVTTADGLAIKDQITNGFAGGSTVSFKLAPFPAENRRMAQFSSTGPNVDLSIKPDLTATGAMVYSATQHLDSDGEMYNASGYAQADGTSFSAPMVAGALALLKSARPGLTAQQYRSLIIDNAAPLLFPDGSQAHLQQAGAGRLDVLAAANAPVVALPAALNFGADQTTQAKTVTLTNLTGNADTFSITVAPNAGGISPAADQALVSLSPGASANVSLSFPNGALPSELYEGYIKVTSANTGSESRIPYWYASAGQPAQISVLDTNSLGGANRTTRGVVTFRITDASGVPLGGLTPVVKIASGDGSVVNVRSIGGSVPQAFQVDYRVGKASQQSIQIQAGDAVRVIPLN